MIYEDSKIWIPQDHPRCIKIPRCWSPEIIRDWLRFQDMDPIFKIFTFILRIVGIVRPPPSESFRLTRNRCPPSKNGVSFRNIWGILRSPKIEAIGFGSHGHVQKSTNPHNDGFWVSPKAKLKSYWSQMKQNNSTELLAMYCLHKLLQIFEQFPIFVLMIFLWVSGEIRDHEGRDSESDIAERKYYSSVWYSWGRLVHSHIWLKSTFYIRARMVVLLQWEPNWSVEMFLDSAFFNYVRR